MEKNQFEILLEDIQGKFDLVLEGHEALRKEILDARAESNEKHDLTAVQITALVKKIDDETGKLNQKIDAIIVDLAEHRDDTEKHRTDYKVSE